MMLRFAVLAGVAPTIGSNSMNMNRSFFIGLVEDWGCYRADVCAASAAPAVVAGVIVFGVELKGLFPWSIAEVFLVHYEEFVGIG